jgi:hypothetical protein
VSASHNTLYTVTENKRFMLCREILVSILWGWYIRNLCGRSAALLRLTQVVWVTFRTNITVRDKQMSRALLVTYCVCFFYVSRDTSVCILKGHVEFRCGFSSTVARLYQIYYQWKVVQVYPSLCFFRDVSPWRITTFLLPIPRVRHVIAVCFENA